MMAPVEKNIDKTNTDHINMPTLWWTQILTILSKTKVICETQNTGATFWRCTCETLTFFETAKRQIVHQEKRKTANL